MTDLRKQDSKSPANRNFLKRTSRFIDFKIGLAGALVMGSIVFYINYHDTQALAGATTASLKQAIYTFLFGGTIMKLCEYLAVGIRARIIALMTAIVIPSCLSIGLTFGVHKIKGTPKPVESTIPTAFLVIPSTAIWGLKKRQRNIKA